MFKLFRNRRHSQEHVDELLSAHLDGELTPDEQAELMALLAREPGLQERLEGLRLTQEALANLPQMEAPRNFILSPAMVAAPAAPPAPPRRPAWLALGWATTAATLLLVIVLAGDIFVVAPPTRQEPSDVVALVTDAPQPALDGGYVLAEVTLETEGRDADLTAQQPAEEKAIAPTVPVEQALVEAPAPLEVEVEGETEAAEQSVAEAMPAAAAPPQEDSLLAGAMSQTPPPPRAVITVTTVQATPELAQQLPSEQPEAEPPAAPMMAVETDDEAQNATLATAKSAATEPGPPTWMTVPTPSVAPTPAPASGAPFWLRGLELVLGLSVVVLAVATWIARRRR